MEQMELYTKLLEKIAELSESVSRKLDGVVKEIGEIKLQTTITSGCLSAQEKRIADLESEKHVPATCMLMPELEGLKRETQGLIRNVSWIMGIIATLLTGSIIFILTKIFNH